MDFFCEELASYDPVEDCNLYEYFGADEGEDQ